MRHERASRDPVGAGSFSPVPPPSVAPVDTFAETLGLCSGLRAEIGNYQYRCACCDDMQRPGALKVWVPDGITKRDPAWSVTEAAREGAYNGSRSAWCLSCAKSFKTPSRPIADYAAPIPGTKDQLRAERAERRHRILMACAIAASALIAALSIYDFVGSTLSYFARVEQNERAAAR